MSSNGGSNATEQAAANETKQPVKNPYAQKKALPEISNKPIHLFSSTSDHVVPQQAENGSTNEQATPFSKPKDSAFSAKEASSSEQSDLNRMPAQSTSKPSLNDGQLPLWQRLPSRNLTFGPAEILTVEEFAQHGHLYVGRSVRVTGKLIHRCIHEDGMVSLVLSDPLIPQRAPSSLRRPSSLGGQPVRRVNFPKTPGTVGQSPSAARLVHKTPLSAYSAVTPGLTIRKRPRPSEAKPLPPLQALVQALSEPACVWIMANAVHVTVDHSVVGDLVMAMGEVQSGTDEDVPAAARPVVDNLRTAEGCVLLQTRIFRNANGANMRQHVDALRARRRRLLATLEAPVDNGILRQGCGPPPYEHIANGGQVT